MNRPPCFARLGVTDCLRRQHDWIVSGNGPLFGQWTGWRIAGDQLVTPDQQRIRLGRVLAVATMDGAGCSYTAGSVVAFRARQRPCTQP